MYSNIVYKVPGKNAGPYGKTYDWIQVTSEDDLNEKLNDGWFASLIDAVNGKKEKPKVLVDNNEPTREEILTKANELKLEFHKNISSKKLKAMIEDKLEG